jgi:hypothetical protein
MAETLIEQMRRAWAQSDHDSGSPMYWSLTTDAYDELRYETKRGEVWHEGPPPTFMGFPIYRGGHGIPKFMLLPGEPPDDQRESELKRQLDMLHREYRDRAQPLIDELAKIESRKPPRLVVDAATLELLRDSGSRSKS